MGNFIAGMPALVHSRAFVHFLVFSYCVPWTLADTTTVRYSFMYVYTRISFGLYCPLPCVIPALATNVHVSDTYMERTAGGAQDGLLTELAAQ